MSKGFTFTAERRDDTVVVELAGQFDMAATFKLEPALERLTRDTATTALVVDMQGVEFIDSSALGLLLATRQRLQTENVRFRVANPSTAVQRLVELTGVGAALDRDVGDA